MFTRVLTITWDSFLFGCFQNRCVQWEVALLHMVGSFASVAARPGVMSLPPFRDFKAPKVPHSHLTGISCFGEIFGQ